MVHTEFTEAITVGIIEPLRHRVHRVIFADVSVFSVSHLRDLCVKRFFYLVVRTSS